MRNVAASAAAALVAGLMVPAAGSADEPGLEPRERSSFGDSPVDSSPALAAGVIVRYRAGVTPAELRTAVAELAGEPTRVTMVSERVRAFVTAPAPRNEAEQLAAELRKRPDVAWAEPNGVVQPLADSPWPVPVTDPYAASLRNVWDMRGPEDSSVTSLGVTPWPVGGYSVKAPSIWPATTGAGLVVSVIDTGVTAHPDLAPNLVAGYDMISPGPGGSLVSANDGDGRDADPSDPGSWTTSDLCYSGQPPRSSSWHGTHVAGTIAAVANNGVGVAGIAPGVKVQPVRVLGRCGGTDADIAAAIMWSAGVSVPGLPANPTPAKIINLSLGGQGTCGQNWVDAINAARGQGATIVVALGNDASPAGAYVPASCPGVIGVHSTSDYGDHASYSNYGPEADVSAPGGEPEWGENDGVLSTVDTGTTTPAGPGYDWKAGTSMASPAAAAVAALIASVGQFGPDQLEAALEAAVAGFPSGDSSWGYVTCNTAECGTGIVDASKVPAPLSAPQISGVPAPGQPLTAVGGSWMGPAQAHALTWVVEGRAVGTGPTYVVSEYDIGKTIVVRESVASGPFAPIGADSAGMAIPVPPPAPPTPPTGPPAKAKAKLKVKMPKRIRVGARARIRLIVKVDGVKKPTGKITIKAGKKTVAKTKLKAKSKGRITIKLPRLRIGKHKITIVFRGGTGIASTKKKVVLVVRRR